jgi:FG-GAP-like repeat
MYGGVPYDAFGCGQVPTNWIDCWRRRLLQRHSPRHSVARYGRRPGIWFTNPNSWTAPIAVGLGNIPTIWTAVGTGDFNGDGYHDILWRDNLGNTAIWLMNGSSILSTASLGNIPTSWSIVQTGDYNGDGMSDLLWRDTSGNTAIWFMTGTTVVSTGAVGSIPTSWTVQSVNAE